MTVTYRYVFLIHDIETFFVIFLSYILSTQASTRCILLNQYGTPTTIPCNDNIEYFENGQCRNVRVRYEGEVCNYEGRKIWIDKKKSKGKLDKIMFAKMKRSIGVGECVTFAKDTIINNCDRTTKTLGT